jgi:glyoxylase-like metal-dependent hydrolase (beta-lactamase superfamily II)/rhodanese-related sulfurtransferase
MYFKQILNEQCGCASYVIASRDSGEAAVVDPAMQIEEYESLLDHRGLTLKYVIDTHVHADHVSGARSLVKTRGGEHCLHESAAVTYPFRPLRDGQELDLGPLRLRVMHTPGHRPELISLLVINPPRSPEPSMVLTGDSLLVGDVGRPDFGGGDPEAQFASVGKLMALPDWIAVFPGHFEGPCGKGMCGRPSTTIGFERMFNPIASLAHDAFVSELVEGTPARPLNMVAIEATNRGRVEMSWAMLTSDERVPEVPASEIDLANAALIDVREPDEYSAGHARGAVNIPQAEIATRINEVPRDEPVYVICQSGSRSLKTTRFLKQTGFEQAVNVLGGTAAWRAAGLPMA